MGGADALPNGGVASSWSVHSCWLITSTRPEIRGRIHISGLWILVVDLYFRLSPLSSPSSNSSLFQTSSAHSLFSHFLIHCLLCRLGQSFYTSDLMGCPVLSLVTYHITAWPIVLFTFLNLIQVFAFVLLFFTSLF